MFYEQWSPYINRQMLPDDLISSYTSTDYEIRQMRSAEFPIDDFMAVGFSLHMEILTKVKTLEERLFYIHRSANDFWNYTTLKRQLKFDLYHKQGSIRQTNFNNTISDDDFNPNRSLENFAFFLSMNRIEKAYCVSIQMLLRWYNLL